jgi:hypothetical protein
MGLIREQGDLTYQKYAVNYDVLAQIETSLDDMGISGGVTGCFCTKILHIPINSHTNLAYWFLLEDQTHMRRIKNHVQDRQLSRERPCVINTRYAMICKGAQRDGVNNS